ncbi:MAG: leucyl/phenylalanyl-tRNA--protein transferase [Desulfovibrionaceae bacterium]|nr:leucyl/phenylalanyl-tRNA--protein transferase [Desulfovibrionaceae bacterium]MDD4951804.1 leucyl/phenylalanyl-tRNA--protein transferase [Desulfovibrionaceae bacterium]
MVIYRLFEDCVFPDPREADPDGLLAVGGDLSPKRLLTAYARGIFPWYAENSPILWWSTDPRPVLVPSGLHVPRRLARIMNQGGFVFSMDRDFEAVIRSCAAAPRPGQQGTWIVEDMVRAYLRLHELGYAHSVEVRSAGDPDGPLAGGLYGVSLGRAFFGESMFHNRAEASKAAFVRLVRQLGQWDFDLVDCQQTTGHVLRFGAREVPRSRFLAMLADSLSHPTRRGRWSFDP